MPQDLFDNPLGTDGFEFVEFTGPDPQALASAVRGHGLHRGRAASIEERAALSSRATSISSSTWSRAARRREFRGAARAFGQRHGVSRAGCRQGAEAVRSSAVRARYAAPVGPMELNIPAIEGIGGSNLYLVDRYGAQEIYDVDFVRHRGGGRARSPSELPASPTSTI